MDQIESFARLSVARGSAFGALAIICTVFGLLGMPVIALKTGGVLCLIACFILLLKAQGALTRPVKRTEVWLMLDPGQRPPAPVAQRLIGDALKGAYVTFAVYFAQVAAASLGLSLLVGPVA